MPVDIVHHRLHNQCLSWTDLTQPEEVVCRLGAVQSQDYAGGKWALGLRMAAATDAAVEQAFAAGKILRTHVMRPTWHFVAPQDIRWLLALTAKRVHATNASMYRQLELDRATIRKSYRVLEKTLQGGKHLTRAELGAAFAQAGIPEPQGMRLGYLMMSAELDAIICSGARRGKQFTYALLEERAPAVGKLAREEALVELTRRYFATRGPATLHDFTWWSGLTMADARAGIQSLSSRFLSEEIGGKTYWFDPSTSPAARKSPQVHLLPNYDEYFIGFRDRSAIGKWVSPLYLEENSVALNAHIFLVDGYIAGGWRRTIKKDRVLIEMTRLTALSRDQEGALERAARQYGDFLGLKAEITQP
jgi:hypothetical protein